MTSVWISLAQGAPYFVDEQGNDWHPIGSNDSIAWINLAPLFGRRDVEAVAIHLASLRELGINCIRLMMECSQSRYRYFERTFGEFNPRMVQLWDDLFFLCARFGLKILLTPFDTFWMWMKWRQHPYNRQNGGPLVSPARMLLDRNARDGIKARLRFAAERWGGSGTLFAWDLWNEIHPAQAEDTADCFDEFIHDLSMDLRTTETRLFGRSHLQTVSLFGPELGLNPYMDLSSPIFRHPDLDFSTIHIYDHPAINYPRNTVDAALSMGRIVKDCIGQVDAARPFLDTEHGPIHTFKDKKITLPEPFDDELFRTMQWAHLASGGAGGGMRWPNRHPHVLTHGMRRAQAALSRFLRLISWATFARSNISDSIYTAPGASKVAAFGCADKRQAVLYLVRRDTLAEGGRMDADAIPFSFAVRWHGMQPGGYRVVPWDTLKGDELTAFEVVAGENGVVTFNTPPIVADMAFAVRALTETSPPVGNYRKRRS